MNEPSKLDNVLKWGVITMVALVIIFTDIQAHHVLMPAPAVTPTEAPSNTPTEQPSQESTPAPTVTAESVPFSSPLPTSTPIPQPDVEECIIEEYDEFYSEILHTLYGDVDDVVVLQLSYCDGKCVMVVLAKIKGVWEIIELSRG